MKIKHQGSANRLLFARSLQLLLMMRREVERKMEKEMKRKMDRKKIMVMVRTRRILESSSLKMRLAGRLRNACASQVNAAGQPWFTYRSPEGVSYKSRKRAEEHGFVGQEEDVW